MAACSEKAAKPVFRATANTAEVIDLYLKSIELVGFKSFAERTKLQFEPGMTAIVGPNGCGKSNISDAMRWVLGEQSAKALRGSNMQDCIFNGTDNAKAHNMAEVSITLADCEEALGTDFNEVTVTRRVLRSGEGQYFINRTPCRLKDIHRMFMDTGIGTNAYSLMEQGRIDRILSSRPEDRRAVFEEASGITKYKADKKEAIRKLEHTEANLQRLADIIREVKRQIISLQRQAGKARRYKAMQEKLRGLDIFVTRERLHELDKKVGTLENQLASVTEQDEALRVDIEESEQKAGQLRRQISEIEETIAAEMDAEVQAKTDLDRNRQVVQLNTDRIKEFELLSERDSKDADNARSNLEAHRESLKRVAAQLADARTQKEKADAELEEKAARLREQDEEVEGTRQALDDMRAESVDLESRSARLQNELSDLEAQERGAVVRRERLHAEKKETQRAAEIYEERQQKITEKLEGLRKDLGQKDELLTDLRERRAAQTNQVDALREAIAELQTCLAEKKAQVEMLQQSFEEDEAYPAGARALLNDNEVLPFDRNIIIGALADKVEAEPEFRKPLEAILRVWIDAVIVRDDKSAMEILHYLDKEQPGAARLLAGETAVGDTPAPCDGAGSPLLDHVSCEDAVQGLVERLLINVRVVDILTDIPYPVLPGVTYVTKGGAVVRGDGTAEFWMPGAQSGNPLSRKHALADRQREREETETQIQLRKNALEKLVNADQDIEASIREAQQAVESGRHAVALCEGEHQVIAEEAKQAQERADTVEWELNALVEAEDTGENRREAIAKEIDQIRKRQSDLRASLESRGSALRGLEQERSAILSEVTECRVMAAECRQRVEHLVGQQEPLEAQIAGLEALVRDRANGVESYRSRIQELEQSIEDARGKLQPLEEKAEQHSRQLGEARERRGAVNAQLETLAEELHRKRNLTDEVRTRKSKLDLELAELRMKRENMLERVTADYRISPDQVAEEPEPEWDDEEAPSRETLETTIAEIRAKLESMGPVNLVAIEEHKELEERYAFLTQQQDDLIKAKQQLMDMIRHINKTTTEMFSQTFEAVNENFQRMFKQLFGGGAAKLVLIDEDDVLESGIEIIARPPGKKLQSVSLLSGGERTLTAVGLLFSLYQVKPSPFCVLDELDAALDESNIGRFVETVKGFLERSQFIVITHNRQTISASDVLYGVTMEKRGISKIVSVKFSDHEDAVKGKSLAPAGK